LVVASEGEHAPRLVAILEGPASQVPNAALVILALKVEQMQDPASRVTQLDKEIARRAKEDAVTRRLTTIPT